MAEAQVAIDRLLDKIRTRVLSVPCPQCGGVQDGPLKIGEKIQCKYCKSFYSIEDSLNQPSKEAIKKIASSVLNEIMRECNTPIVMQLDELSNLLQAYAKEAFEEVRNFHDLQRKLPTCDELDAKLEEKTQEILEAMASASKQLLRGQENLMEGQATISVKVDSVTGKVDSISVDVKEIKRLLECMEQAYGKKFYGVELVKEVVLCCIGENKASKEIVIKDDVVIGRNEKTNIIEVRFPDGQVRDLGIADLTVSRNHLKVKISEGAVTLTDLNSKNGTYVNGKKIPQNVPFILRSDAQVQLGLNTRFELKF